MNIYKIAFLCSITFLLFSCKKYADPSSVDLGYSYYPINVGDYSLYQVIDSTFLGVGLSSVDTFMIREEIHEPITVSEEERFQLYVYYKKQNEPWKSYPDSVWTVFRDGGRIVRVRNNVRFVPLVFPLEVEKKWDGNISDATVEKDQFYTMKNVYRPFAYDSYYYPKTVSVEILNDASAIDNNLFYDVYANGFGLVYKEEKEYNYDQTQIGLNIVESGHHLIQKLVLHGKYK